MKARAAVSSGGPWYPPAFTTAATPPRYRRAAGDGMPSRSGRRSRRPPSWPYAPGEPLGGQRSFSSYSCGPSASSTVTASRLPSCAARSRDSPQPTAARNPARNASPVPVGSALRCSGTGPTSDGRLPAPLHPGSGRAQRGYPHLDPVQDVGAAPPALALDRALPRTRCRTGRPRRPPARAPAGRRAAAAAATGRRRTAGRGAAHSRVCASIASGSLAPISTRSRPPAPAASGARSISASSLIAPA